MSVAARARRPRARLSRSAQLCPPPARVDAAVTTSSSSRIRRSASCAPSPAGRCRAMSRRTSRPTSSAAGWRRGSCGTSCAAPPAGRLRACKSAVLPTCPARALRALPRREAGRDQLQESRVCPLVWRAAHCGERRTAGTTHVVLEPVDFIARLAALVPPPRMHLHLRRFHGVFAPHAAPPCRPEVIAKILAHLERTASSQLNRPERPRGRRRGWPACCELAPVGPCRSAGSARVSLDVVLLPDRTATPGAQACT
jgi:hypothetical protein